MADPAIMAANEQWKSISRTMFQLGTVLLSATVLEIYRRGLIALETASWLVGAFALMFVGWKVLHLLESAT